MYFVRSLLLGKIINILQDACKLLTSTVCMYLYKYVSLCMYVSAAISLRLQGKLSFPYNCQKMNGQIYVLLC